MGNYKLAEEYYMKSLNIRTQLIPSDDPILAVMYSNIGALYSDQE